MEKTKKHLLSVIVPAYNEEKVIASTIKSLRDSLERDFDYEILVIDDGSSDRTYEVAQRVASSKIKIFKYKPNRGKGHALKYGFSKGRGDIIVFYDSGLDFPASQIEDFIDILKEEKVDLVIGSKRHPKSKVDYPWHRRLVSIAAQGLVKSLFNLGVTDTQVGLKVFKRKVLEKIMPRVLVKRYAFDIEILALAQHYNFKIRETPVDLKLKFSTAVSFNSLLKTLTDTLAVFYRLRILKFYDLPYKERRRLIREYPVTILDKIICYILGDTLNRKG